MTCNFCHLHGHSGYSFRDGLAPPIEIVRRAAQLRQTHIAQTDHGNLFGAANFVKACSEIAKPPEEGGEGFVVQPILGMEIYEALPHAWDPERDAGIFKEKWDPDKPRYHHLTLWVLNAKGWENISALHTLSFTKDYKPKNQPLIDRATLERHSEGLAVGLGCAASRTNVALRRGEDGYDAAKWYVEVFEDRVWVEVMANLPDQVALINGQRRLAKRIGRPTVADNDYHYVRQEDGREHGSHHVLVQARRWKKKEGAEETGDKSDDGYGRWYGSDGFYIKSQQEMEQTGGFNASEIAETMNVANRVEFDFTKLTRPSPPQAPVPMPGVDLGFDRWLAMADT